MAMTTKLATKQFSLKRRIRQFYELLNQLDVKRCFQMIDPRIRRMPTAVTFFQYENSLAQFLESHGSMTIHEVDIKLHLGEPSTLYENRDFALGKVAWQNEAGELHFFLERWVREGRAWYTRSTGFVAPTSPKKKIPTSRTPTRKVKTK
jgi:hypothetical protein